MSNTVRDKAFYETTFNDLNTQFLDITEQLDDELDIKKISELKLERVKIMFLMEKLHTEYTSKFPEECDDDLEDPQDR